ncbi:MAG: 50S ribosomal protein L13 [Thermoprotei archaeon]|nr:MAG: 50S ribosomal protein L13 [Thermoprotei archaeon]RLF00370.1 MAG: 50S ribosomal protein L13 [Thermoprotei archaeon]HDI75487.1 50S ribosomal protein L13 [Thermoprotei archaeon]
MKSEGITIIDAKDHVAGRLASIVAKRLLRGEKIVIVNAEKAVIIGDRLRIINIFKRRLTWRTYYNPEKVGPKLPVRPDGILKRMIRGMLPYKQHKGKIALKRLRVYIGVPDEFKDKPMEKVKEALKPLENYKYIYLEELAKSIGWVG